MKDFADCLVSCITPAYRYIRFGLRHPPLVSRGKTTRKGPNPSEDYNQPLAGRRGSVGRCHHHARRHAAAAARGARRTQLLNARRASQRRTDEPRRRPAR